MRGVRTQRSLLQRLAALADAQAKVGVALLALECMRLVTGVLGEVPAEASAPLVGTVHAQLTSQHAALRSQVLALHHVGRLPSPGAGAMAADVLFPLPCCMP